MEVTNFYLDVRQKSALKERAKMKGTNLAEEIRTAVDAYLSGVTLEEIELLDVATKHAQKSISEMNEMLRKTNLKANKIFAELEKLKGKQ